MAIINYGDNNNYYFIETQNVQNPGHGGCIPSIVRALVRSRTII